MTQKDWDCAAAGFLFCFTEMVPYVKRVRSIVACTKSKKMENKAAKKKDF